MSYHIHISSVAEQDISRAADYIEFILKNPKAADDLLDEAEHQINSLSSFPERYPLVDDPFLSSFGLRATSVNNFLVFYLIPPNDNLVIIVRFLYQKSNWNSILYDDVTNY